MRSSTIKFLTSQHKEIEKLTPYQYNTKYLDYSKIPTYDTQKKTKYDPTYLPFWEEPCNCLIDPDVNEVVVLKCVRAGASENILLNGIRYIVGTCPQPTLYIGGKMESSIKFYDSRIKLSLKACPPSAKKLKQARQTKTITQFDDMTLICGWAKSKMIYKQDSYSVIYCDEFSTFEDFSADLLRRRQANYNFSKLFLISAPDITNKKSSNSDPVFIEIEDTDKRMWFMKDPKRKKKEFTFELGTRETIAGLKWDKKAWQKVGGWDYDKVRKSAHYVTPSGHKIYEKDRSNFIANGKWKVTAKPNSKGKRGYIINAFYMPWFTFGDIAVAWAKANQSGPLAIKAFFAEYMAKPWYDKKDSVRTDIIYDRQANYKKGENFSETTDYKQFYVGKEMKTFISVDVQVDHLYTLAREWCADTGDSGLIDHRTVSAWEDIEQFANETKAFIVGVDNNYAQRQTEVLEYCEQTGSIEIRGRGNLSLPYQHQKIDPHEGKMGSGNATVHRYYFNPDQYKSILLTLFDATNTSKWLVYKDIDDKYVNEVNSNEKLDGIWKLKRGHWAEHRWDLEIYQLLMANIFDAFHSKWFVHGFIDV